MSTVRNIYIENGVAIDPTWEGHIVTSENGTDWEVGVPKHDLTVKIAPTNNRKDFFILFQKEDQDILRFDPKHVPNKPAWAGGATALDCAFIALAEILTWFPSAGSGGSGLATEATQLNVLSTLSSILAENKLDFEMRTVRDSNGDLFQLRGTLDEEAGTTVWDYIDATGSVAVPVGAVTFLDQSSLLSQILTEVTPSAGTVNSSSSTGAGNTTLGAKSVAFSVVGSGATVNGVVRPDGWNFVYEAENRTLPVIAYDGAGSATIYVDEII